MVLRSPWKTAKLELEELKRSLPPSGAEQALWKKSALDPVAWVLDNKLLPALDPWQISALRSQAHQAIWLINRQAGKSTIAALIALHRAIYKPGLILMVSRSIRQSGELFKKFESAYSKLEDPPGMTKSTELSCELANGSRVVSLPDSEGTVRGFSSVDLLIEDESSRVSDDLYFAIRPMLAISQGQLLLLGTPAGRRGHFYETWISDSPGWEKVLITADDCPRISKNFLNQERLSMPESVFLTEYFCQFQDNLDQIFSSDLVDSLFNDQIEPLFPQRETLKVLTISDSLINPNLKTLAEEAEDGL